MGSALPVLNREWSSGRVLITVPYFPRLFSNTGLANRRGPRSWGSPDLQTPYLMQLNLRGALTHTSAMLLLFCNSVSGSTTIRWDVLIGFGGLIDLCSNGCVRSGGTNADAYIDISSDSDQQVRVGGCGPAPLLTSFCGAGSRRDRVINSGRWPSIGCIDQDGQWGQGKEGPLDLIGAIV